MKTKVKAWLYKSINPDLMRLALTLTPVAVAMIGIFLPDLVIIPDAPHTGGMCNGGG